MASESTNGVFIVKLSRHSEIMPGRFGVKSSVIIQNPFLSYSFYGQTTRINAILLSIRLDCKLVCLSMNKINLGYLRSLFRQSDTL